VKEKFPIAYRLSPIVFIVSFLLVLRSVSYLVLNSYNGGRWCWTCITL